jgi:hypothetical protein
MMAFGGRLTIYVCSRSLWSAAADLQMDALADISDNDRLEKSWPMTDAGGKLGEPTPRTPKNSVPCPRMSLSRSIGQNFSGPPKMLHPAAWPTTSRHLLDKCMCNRIYPVIGCWFLIYCEFVFGSRVRSFTLSADI